MHAKSIYSWHGKKKFIKLFLCVDPLKPTSVLTVIIFRITLFNVRLLWYHVQSFRQGLCRILQHFVQQMSLHNQHREIWGESKPDRISNSKPQSDTLWPEVYPSLPWYVSMRCQARCLCHSYALKLFSYIILFFLFLSSVPTFVILLFSFRVHNWTRNGGKSTESA